MPIPDSFHCLMVRKDAAGVRAEVETISLDDLPPGEVVIRVRYSSLNYKDALACRATKGIVGSLPHVPGIDCAGEVAATDSADYATGEEVLVTGYGLGAERWGGLCEYVRVPAEWVVRLPKTLTAKEAMTYGTAGFTAAQSVAALRRNGVAPEDGEIVVTGASGGVGSLAVGILAKLGYQAAAATGKPVFAETLKRLGAERILAREEVHEDSDSPLLKAVWAGAVDTVGGATLATLLRSTKHRGCVTACGLVAGIDLSLTVYPFILRGVTLAGIDSAKCPRASRLDIWERLAGDWKLDCLDSLAREVMLGDVPGEVEAILAGESRGRVVVKLGSDE